MEQLPYRQIVVIGGTGQTGHRVVELLLQLPEAPKVYATSRKVENGIPAGPLASTIMPSVSKWRMKVDWSAVDLEASPVEVKAQLQALAQKLKTGLPTALIFAAAFTNVDGCETDPAKCERINEVNTIQVLDWGHQALGAKTVFYSTDYVFDGTQGPYREDAPRCATSKYGQSKVLVEEWIEKKISDALILRTTGVYDYLSGSKNFLMQMIELWGKGQFTRIPSDQSANPVWAKELAQATIDLLRTNQSGIFNVAGGSLHQRSDFAALIAHHFGFDLGLIQPTRTAELGQKAKRPLKGGLDCTKLKSAIGWAPAPATELVPRFAEQHRKSLKGNS